MPAGTFSKVFQKIKTMTILYSTLASLYEEMYRHIFDYEKEYCFYDSILQSFHCKKILEVACGTGMLAVRFLDNGYDYLGVDISHQMLDIARAKIKTDVFVQCDMRKLPFYDRFDAVLLTGRSVSYITENQGIIDTLAGIHHSLKNNGIFVFGIFEANAIFDTMNDSEQIFELNNKKIKRINTLRMNLKTGWTYDWHAKYFIEHDGMVSEFADDSTLRAFTRDEILLFLKLAGFKVKDIIEEDKVMTLITEKK